jgi:virginiamycin B lyase
MQNRCRRALFVAIVISGASGVGKQALAQTVTEFPIPTPGSLPSGITVGPDGALWFTESGGVGKIGRITTAGVITEFEIPDYFESQPNGITTGPDGALWFAQTAGIGLGSVTTAGIVTEYQIPLGTGAPYGITSGPEESLWYSSAQAGNIGRITVGGQEFEYLPAGLGVPFAIATGPDGALWLAGLHAVSRGGRVSPRHHGIQCTQARGQHV